MKKGYDLGGKYSQDPIGSDAARGKHSYQRKHRYDPGFTPSEQALKNRLMRQFMKNPEGTHAANTTAYTSAPCWCASCGRHFRLETHDVCFLCLNVSTGDIE